MTIRSHYIWYYICDDKFSYYPVWKPAPLFEVIDGSLSSFWIYSFTYKPEIYFTEMTIAYPEWAKQPLSNYDKLSDGCYEEVEIFNKYKSAMDLEFPLPWISEIANIIDGKWLLCNSCHDAWESMQTRNAMVICPNCNTIMHIQDMIFK